MARLDEEETDGPHATRIRSVARAARLIRLVAGTPDGITAEMARTHLGVSLPTAYHLLNTLADEGIFDKYERRYHLGPAAGVIADAYLRQASVPPYLTAPLAELSRVLGETVTLCIWRNGGVWEVAVHEGSKPLQVGGRGMSLQQDLHARASGKLLLSTLDEADLEHYLEANPLSRRTANTITDIEALKKELRLTRERGWAMEYEECDEGVACLAAPVRRGNERVAAYTLGAPAWRLTENKERYLEALFAAAADADRR